MTDLTDRLHATSKKFPDEFGCLCLDAKAEIDRLQKRVGKAEAIMTRCLAYEGEVKRLKIENETLKAEILRGTRSHD